MLTVRDGGSAVPLWTKPAEEDPSDFDREMLRGGSHEGIVAMDPIYRGFGGQTGMVFFEETPVGSITKVPVKTESVFAFHVGFVLQTVKFFKFSSEGENAHYQILDQAKVEYPL